MKTNKSNGFSVIEILFAVAILVILSGVILGSFSGFRNTQLIQNETDSVVSILSRAKSESLSSLNLLSYGVHFDEDQTVIFSEETYDEDSINNEVFSLNPGVVISNINLSGGSEEVIFDRLNGNTSSWGTITLNVLSDVSKTRTITITQTGVISSN